ncbi:MAG: hypothetical protein WEC59_06650 [Salibacteraceae bacterium]
MRNKVLRILAIVLGALFLLFFAFLNGYPIVYADTSTFLASGFELETPFDRPITYGLFLWLTSFAGLTLWGPIFFQSLILSFLIFKVTALFLPDKKLLWGFILLMALLSTLTGVSWVASQLISDVFTPIMVLSLLLILIGRHSAAQKAALFFLYTLAVAMHMSHVSIGIVLIILAALYFLLLEKKAAKPVLINLSIALALTIASIFTMGSALSKSKHAFLFAALVEHGIVKEYLDEHCGEENYRMCEYKDQLPDKAWVFLWDESSPFYALGDFKGTKDEFNEIINATLTSPKYLVLHVKASLQATFDQLLRFNMGDGNGDFMAGTLLHERVARYVSHELDAYERSKQNQKSMSYVSTFNLIQHVFIALTAMFLLWMLMRWKTLDPQLRGIIVLTTLAVLVNAWACGTFANAIDRLGVKMIWLIPLVVFYGVLGRTRDESITKE